MSGAPELERSVLERKERNELHVIAESLGMKPGSRTKKADLVDQILRATGVEIPASANGDGRTLDVHSTVAAGDGTSEPTAPDQPADGGAASLPTLGELGLAVATPGAADGGQHRSSGSESRPNERSGERQGGHQASQQPGSQPPGWRNDGGQRGNTLGETEPGNRSRRRRRGRDRGPDREIQAQERSADVPFTGEPVDVEGFLDLSDEGFGFLRTQGFTASPKDIYVSVSQVRRFGLRKGDYLVGGSRPANPGEKFPALLRIDTVSNMTPDEARLRPRFEDLTPLFPDQKLRMETPGDASNVTARIVDLMCPIGKGQRGLIVSPPKAGKTTVIKQIAKSIETNNPEVHLIVLLVDERPEEVTDMRRTVQGEVIYSTFDRPADEHTQVAELALERAKRLVEGGGDVVIILDGITRLTRAYNLSAPASGRLTSGGIDQAAIYPPKKFFGAARNAEEGGSLTILATALVETGSKADDVIFEELKGTGNMELRLDRRLAERRLYPAIDVNASSTRHEELLFERGQLQLVWRLRRVLNGLAEDGTSWKALELLMDKIKTTKTNDEFLAEVSKTQAPV
jgi:transcription termination factor Rho